MRIRDHIVTWVTVGALLALLLGVLGSQPGRQAADMGPKPSVVVELEGIGDHKVYGTFLTEQNSPMVERSVPEEIREKFTEFGEGHPDLRVQLCFLQECKEPYTLGEHYMPPSCFGILLYFPEKNVFLVSTEENNTYAFHSRFVMDLSAFDLDQYEDETLFVEGCVTSHAQKKRLLEGVAFAFRLVVNTLVEVVIARQSFKLRKKKTMGTIIGANVLTQAILNWQIMCTEASGRWLLFYFPMLELGIFVLEAILYGLFFDEEEKGFGKVVNYAFVANFCTAVLGFILAVVFPLFFE